MKIIAMHISDCKVSDMVICENVRGGYGEMIKDFLNGRSDNQRYIYNIVDDDYKLYKFES